MWTVGHTQKAGIQEEVEPSTLEEITNATAAGKVRDNKFREEDRLLAKLFKFGGHKLITQIYKIMTKIWKNLYLASGTLESYLLHKKGDQLNF